MIGWNIEPQKLQCVHLDFCGPLPPSSNGNKYVLIIIERYSGWSALVPTKDATANTAARALYSQWICKFGCPQIVVSDNGPHFTGEDFLKAADIVGYRVKHTTTYHPQANGIAERRFREMGKAIRIYSQTLDSWESILPEATLSFHNTINKSVGYSPAQLFLGQQLRLPYDYEPQQPI